MPLAPSGLENSTANYQNSGYEKPHETYSTSSLLGEPTVNYQNSSYQNSAEISTSSQIDDSRGTYRSPSYEATDQSDPSIVTIQKPFACDNCPKRFATRHNCNRHIETAHGNAKFKRTSHRKIQLDYSLPTECNVHVCEIPLALRPGQGGTLRVRVEMSIANSV